MRRGREGPTGAISAVSTIASGCVRVRVWLVARVGSPAALTSVPLVNGAPQLPGHLPAIETVARTARGHRPFGHLSARDPRRADNASSGVNLHRHAEAAHEIDAAQKVDELIGELW